MLRFFGRVLFFTALGTLAGHYYGQAEFAWFVGGTIGLGVGAFTSL